MRKAEGTGVFKKFCAVGMEVRERTRPWPRSRRGLAAECNSVRFGSTMHSLGERAMNSVLRFVQVIALGTWVGSIIYFVVITQGIFGVLQSRDQTGLMVAYSLGRLHYLGMVAAVLYLVTGLALVQSVRTFLQPAMIGVVLMLALTVVTQTRVMSRLAELRTEMVSVDATPKDNPLRVEFDRLHQMSVRIEVAVLLIGIAALYLTVGTAPK